MKKSFVIAVLLVGAAVTTPVPALAVDYTKKPATCSGLVIESRSPQGARLWFCLDGKYDSCIDQNKARGFSQRQATADCDDKLKRGLIFKSL